MSTLSIRNALPTDSAIILQFILELARYEKAEHEVEATAATIEQALFAPGAVAHAILCYEEETPIGFALYFFNFSTWQAKKGLYLEDLYVTPAKRKSGAGRLLMKHLAQIAVDNECGRFEWSVLDWNQPAIQFYESIHARPQTEWIRYRLSGSEIRDLI